jgi:predicted secreted Zn-dependent protease
MYLSDMTNRPRIAAFSLALALVAAACGGSGGAPKTATPIATAQRTAAAPTTAPTRAATRTAAISPTLPTVTIGGITPISPALTAAPPPPTTAPPTAFAATLTPVSDPPGSAPGTVAGVVANAAMQYYDITGTTATELRASINASGPVDSSGQHNDALTMWNIDWTWPLNPDSSCILSNATITTTITVTFPRWSPAPGASATLVQQWNTYQAALVTHESGHVSFVVATAPDVLAAIKGATCATAEAAAQAAVARIRQHDVDYDAETSHGATQGARFP